MRTADICPTCATYTNALCSLYNGAYLTNTKVDTLDSMEVAMEKINTNLVPKTGTGAPASNAVYIGQFYVNTAGPHIYWAKSVGLGASDWIFLA